LFATSTNGNLRWSRLCSAVDAEVDLVRNGTSVRRVLQ